ncbi:MAG TPA: hypothetical protein PK987_07615 [Ferruginibacter sp.]|nr:hypothetical protein [Ferruginibacter sp.]
MKDSRSLLLLLVSLLLVLVSFGLLWTWGYRVYNKDNQSVSIQKETKLDSVAIANHIRDSLQKVYTATLHELDVQLDSTLTNTDSLKLQLDTKLAEFYRLRDEIAIILTNRKSGADFKTAKQKIGELQSKVQVIKDKNQEVENENVKLNEALGKLKNGSDNKKKPEVVDKSPDKTDAAYTVFTASDITFRAIDVSDDTETETSRAENTDRFTCSFTVKNFNSQLSNADIFLVILQPDGRVLKTSGWDSGTFNTSDGRKVYSYKFNFKYSKGEAKRLICSLKTSNLQSGSYSMEIFYNGQPIAKTTKTLL